MSEDRRHRAAAADAFGMKVTGWLGYRLGTIFTWARALTFSHDRGHRISTFEQAHGQAGPDGGERDVVPTAAPQAGTVGQPGRTRIVAAAGREAG